MRLSEIASEDLRSEHEAFIEAMKRASAQDRPSRFEPTDVRYDPNWREKLRSAKLFANIRSGGVIG